MTTASTSPGPTKNPRELWESFRQHLCVVPSVGLRVDLSRVELPAPWLDGMKAPIERAFAEMAGIERGDIVNTDEQRRVGHYWLRDAARAPEPAITHEIEHTVASILAFAAEVHSGKVRGHGGTFTDLIVIGIGGSSLGPRFVGQALGGARDKLRLHFLDNTDPDGFDLVFDRLGVALDRTLTVVISKSGGTKETRNGMLEAKARYDARKLAFGQHAVAVTGDGSELAKYAAAEHFIATFPMWDWVGGRTSELSAVGLLPAALQGIDIQAMLDGARACDETTRVDPRKKGEAATKNPAMALALAWHHETHGRGEKDMVILPYKDRLSLLSQYLQQLVMESLGKRLDRDGNVANQGIAVYGNKGSTDQHAYVQQLRDGVPNFFATFIEVLRDHTSVGTTNPTELLVEPGISSGDFLLGFLLGTRRALYESGRRSITITIDDVTPRTVGAIIALYERAVGFYGGLVNINAYHQPGVEAGKKAAEAVITVERKALEALGAKAGHGLTAEELAAAIGAPDEVETVFHVLEHLAANPSRGVKRTPGADLFSSKYSV